MAANHLPQLDRLFLTDGGLETDMIFNEGRDLPCFASITMLRDAEGRRALDAYFRRYLDIARRSGTGFLLESVSWRASPDWAAQLDMTIEELDELNRQSIVMLRDLRDDYQSPNMPVVVSGCIGPRGDGYDPGRIMRRDEAEAYHQRQANVLASAGPDMLSAITMNNVNEAIGIARAARNVNLPVVVSFTVETDGRLPTGDSIEAAIEAVDDDLGGYPAYFMINCAHPSHFEDALRGGGAWAGRIKGIRANASRCSHAELDAMTELDSGNPQQLGREYQALRTLAPHLTVLGGCCGTDHHHVAAIAEACMA
jgi:S-methylmethionine-dependent homocysteine/selenocysteine methylase